MRGGALLLVLGVVACGSGPQGAPAPVAIGAEASDRVAPPETREAFLRALMPVPGEYMVVVYDVRGPAGLGGSMELMVAAGGHRRENWSLTLPIEGGGVATVRGTTIQTPDQIWSGEEGQAGARAPVPLGDLADAYVAADAATRKAAFRGVVAWREDLAAARREHPGETRKVAGETCLWQRIAAQTLCIWEETGIALRYEGPALTVEAVRIDREPSLSRDAFALPAAATSATLEPAASPFDPGESLRTLAKGETSNLALLLQPGFRPPSPPTP